MNNPLLPNPPFGSRLDVKIFLIITLTTLVTAAAVFSVSYTLFYRLMVDDMRARTRVVNEYARQALDPESFTELNAPEDAALPVYGRVQRALNTIRQIAAVRYLYTAKRDPQGRPIYLIDGLNLDAQDFRGVGSPIEPEILPVLDRCLSGEIVESDDIMNTDWGAIFITCWPVRERLESRVVGAVVMEFDAQGLYRKNHKFILYSLLIAAGLAAIFIVVAAICLRKVSEPFYKKLAYTDYLTGLNNRTAFELDLREWERNGEITGLTLVVYDLNNLKTVNDRLGHAAGDAYIREMASLIASSQPGASGVNYRIGGDEFVTVTEGRSLDEIQRLTDELFRRSRRLGEKWFEFSHGSAIYDPERDRNLHDTLTRADQAMYACKKNCKEHRKEPISTSKNKMP